VPTFWEEGLHEHEKILEAVRRKDPLSAGKCSRDHLLRVYETMVSSKILEMGDPMKKG